MILKRKKEETLSNKIGNFIWPSMGWARFVTYVKKRIVRMPGSSRRIALGFALGVACSFNPFVGTHIMQAALLCVILRANVASSALGTLVGNPSTFPIMWWSALLVGQTLLNLFGHEVSLGLLSDKTGLTDLLRAAHADPWQILLPWTVGAYVLGAASLPIVYALAYPVIKGAKKARAKLIEAGRKARQKKEKEQKEQKEKKEQGKQHKTGKDAA